MSVKQDTDITLEQQANPSLQQNQSDELEGWTLLDKLEEWTLLDKSDVDELEKWTLLDQSDLQDENSDADDNRYSVSDICIEDDTRQQLYDEPSAQHYTQTECIYTTDVSTYLRQFRILFSTSSDYCSQVNIRRCLYTDKALRSATSFTLREWEIREDDIRDYSSMHYHVTNILSILIDLIAIPKSTLFSAPDYPMLQLRCEVHKAYIVFNKSTTEAMKILLRTLEKKQFHDFSVCMYQLFTLMQHVLQARTPKQDTIDKVQKWIKTTHNYNGKDSFFVQDYQTMGSLINIHKANIKLNSTRKQDLILFLHNLEIITFLLLYQYVESALQVIVEIEKDGADN